MPRASIFAIAALAAFPAALPVSAQVQLSVDSLSTKAANVSGVTLDQSTLKLVAGFLGVDKATDSGFQKILASIKSIAFKRYSFAQEGAYERAELEPLRAVLRNAGWSQLFTREQGGRQSTVYMKMDGLQISGVTAINLQPKEVLVVSVEGAFDLAKLAQLAGHMGVPDQAPDQKTPDQKTNDQKGDPGLAH